MRANMSKERVAKPIKEFGEKHGIPGEALEHIADTREQPEVLDASSEVEEHKALSPQEQAEMLRNYVASMQKVEGHSNESVRNVIEAVYKRLLLVLNYSALSKLEGMKEVKVELKKVYEDEIRRYADGN
jgi:dihydroneopterin aldolase